MTQSRVHSNPIGNPVRTVRVDKRRTASRTQPQSDPTLWQMASASPLFTLVILEVTLGGSGRSVAYSNVTLRMVLFGICVLISLTRWRPHDRVTGWAYELAALFASLLVIGAANGAHNYGLSENIFEDVKALSYFLMLPYFATELQKRRNVELAARLIRVASVILGIAYLLLFLAQALGLVSFATIYAISEESDQFVFRGEEGAFFYKGFVYICIGIIFFISKASWKSYGISLVLFVALWLTYTRMFIIFTVLCFILNHLFDSLRSPRSLLIVTAAVLAAAGAVPYFMESMGDRMDSDRARYEQFNEVEARITDQTRIIGHGLGVGVPSRPIHMEISYLEIFHKQGLIGLAFWAWLLVIGLQRYLKTMGTTEAMLGKPFFLSIVAIYSQSVGNPFINNSIGMSMVFIALSALRTLSCEADRKRAASPVRRPAVQAIRPRALAVS